MAWRPFLRAIWGALTTDNGDAPKGTVWTRQVRHALLWFQAFLKEQHGGIYRPFTLESYLARPGD
eukprot:8369176-Heterocapsa_arctica.AAC.1